jgi:hypothetical protein
MPTYRKTTKPKLPIQRTVVAPRFRAKPSKTPAIPLGGPETPGQTAKRVAAKRREERRSESLDAIMAKIRRPNLGTPSPWRPVQLNRKPR